MASKSPIPVIVCGQQAEIAKSVQAALLPEYEVIHIILSASAGSTEIPSLLSSIHQPATPDAHQVGTQNYSQKPQAVICGAAYDERAVEAMRRACVEAGLEDGGGVPWLTPDLNVERPPIEVVGKSGYGEYMTKRVKSCLEKLQGEGRLGSEDSVVLY